MLMRIVAALLLVGGISASAFAADDAATKEASTAVMHAKFSAASKDISGVHLHLHHVVNCLVGKDGAGFDASAGDPCQGMGNGAINDATDADMKSTLQDVLAEAQKGLADNNLDSAQATASDVHDMLQDLLGGSSDSDGDNDSM
ncbi:MAG TPA: hypothetical protein VJ998_00705 [Pseudomonadales bacterium]|nr:hypothetical protein [Pseudomonadales bacterium]